MPSPTETVHRIARMFRLARHARKRRVQKKWRRAAIKAAESGWWRGMDTRSVALATLREPLMCMPFSDFHGVVEDAMGTSVWTHEFCDPQILIGRILERDTSPTNPFITLARLRMSMGVSHE